MAPVNPIRIRLRYAELDTFAEKFAPNVTRGGVFLASRNVQPVGTMISFEIQLAGGEAVLAGQGRVTWVKDFDPAEPNRAFGMGVQFVTVEPATKPILARIIRLKDASGHRRTTTGPFLPLGSGTSGPQSAGHGGGAGTNGRSVEKPAAPAVDTSVDLAAEYGLDEQTVRRVMERTWWTGARDGVELAELLTPEPMEAVSLAQALSDLPRLLDPQYSRRRATTAFRAPDKREPGLGSAGDAFGPAGEAARSPIEITATGEPDHRIADRSYDQVDQGDPGVDRDDRVDEGSAAESSEGVRTEPQQPRDLDDTTDMTGQMSLESSLDPMPVVEALQAAAVAPPTEAVDNGHLDGTD